MPPYKKVPSLIECGTEVVLRTISAVILEEISLSETQWVSGGPPLFSIRLQIIRDILANSVGSCIMQDILNIFLEKDEAVEPTVRYLALQMLLVKGVLFLGVGHFPEGYYTFVLDAIADSAADIERLDLRGLWVRKHDKFSLCKVLRRLHKIRHLILRYVCDDELLSVIGKHCPNLELLDISGSNKISDSGICTFLESRSRAVDQNTCQVSQLQIIDCGGPGAQNLPPSIGAKLLLGIPTLKSLGSFEKSGESLEMIHNEYPNAKVDLRYIHDKNTNSHTLSVIIKTSPQVQAIYLDSPRATAIQHLNMLKNLTELKLCKVKWKDLEPLLNDCGKKLRCLCLLRLWGNLDLLTIGILCPDLVRLELHSVFLAITETSHPYSLKKVKQLLIYDSEINPLCVKLILNQSVEIESMSLGNCNILTDNNLITNLIDESLRKTKSIWLGLASKLTIKTVQAFINHCPDLINLGNLSSWNVHASEVELLRIQFIVSNMDITLHEYGPSDDDEDGIFIEMDE